MNGVNKLGFLILAGVTLCLMGCNGGGGGEGGTPTTSTDKEEAVPLNGRSVKIAAFQGGFGIDHFEQAAVDWTRKSGTAATVEGDPRIWERLRPIFGSDDAPDVTWPGWGMDIWGQVYDGNLMDVTAALDEPAFGQTEGKWRDSFDAQLLKLGEFEGKQYMLPYHVNINGWWINKKLFDENKWTVPQNFDELLVLNDQIKAKGIAPMTYQGQYPYYMLYGFIYPWTISHGGIDTWNKCVNMEPGAWKSPSVIEAARRVDTLRKRGDFLKGSLALNHTDAQMSFLKGDAAMIPCGTWLFSEMEKVMPEGSLIEFMRVPNLPDGKGDPTAVQVGIEPWVIPAKAKNTKDGIDYFKFLTQPEQATKFIETKGTVMAVKVAGTPKYPAHLDAAAKALNDSTEKWNAEIHTWYPTFAKAAQDALAALLDGKITPEQFADRCEAAAEAVRKNPEIVKHKI